jgi:hypothetical protein
MSINYVRHTLRPALKTLRLRKSQVVKYASDMAGAPSGETDATYVVYGFSPMYRFAGDADNAISMEINIPEDRVPGTDLDVQVEYFMAGPAGLGVLLSFGFAVMGLGDPPPALGSETLRYMAEVGSPNVKVATTKIWAPEVDGKKDPINIQAVVRRHALAAWDVDPNYLYLVKVVVKYQAYL